MPPVSRWLMARVRVRLPRCPRGDARPAGAIRPVDGRGQRRRLAVLARDDAEPRPVPARRVAQVEAAEERPWPRRARPAAGRRRRAGGATLLDRGLHEGRQVVGRRRPSTRTPSKPTTLRSSGTREAELLGRADHAGGEQVALRDDRGRPVRGGRRAARERRERALVDEAAARDERRRRRGNTSRAPARRSIAV